MQISADWKSMADFVDIGESSALDLLHPKSS